MVRIFLITTILLLSFLIFIGIQKKKPETSSVLAEVPSVEKVSSEVFNKFKEINSGINGITCENIQVKIWDQGNVVSINGHLRYEKPKNFRLILKGVLGKELDLGSNQDVFWFWGKRSDEKGLFFAKHEDYQKTRLKTPFNPVWIMHSLGVDEIPEGSFTQTGIIQESVDSFGKSISIATLIDEKGRAEKIFTSDSSGKLLISVSFDEYVGLFAKIITYNWHEEGRIMKITFKDPKETGVSNPKLWEMPNIHPQIDMGKE